MYTMVRISRRGGRGRRRCRRGRNRGRGRRRRRLRQHHTSFKLFFVTQ